MPPGKYLFLFLLLICFIQISFAQAIQTKEPNYRDAVLDRQFGILGEVQAKPAGVEGTYYLNDDWRTGNIFLKSNDTIEAYPLKYDIEKDLMEIQTDQDIKVLAGDKIAVFELANAANTQKSVFVNGSFYVYEGAQLTGFYEVLSPGKAQLLSRTSLEKMKSNYNVALDVGSRADKILKKERFFIGRDRQAYGISAKKEEVALAFDTYSDQVLSYAKTNKLKFNKKEDLVQIVTYYNTLIK